MTSWQTHPWVARAEHEIRFATAGGPLRDPEQILGFARHAEELGFDAVWYNDHPMRLLDCFSVLSAVAAVTTRLRLFPLVACVYYRSAAHTARQAADVDRLSGGRLVLGLGAGDDEAEFRHLGAPFPSTGQRQAELEQHLAAVREYWGDGTGDGFGDQMRFGPVQQAGIPVLIAGGGEKVTLKQVARLADMSNFGPHEWSGAAYDVDDVARKLAVLKRHCDEIGRPYDSVLRSHYSPLVVLSQDRDRLADKVAAIPPNPREHFIPLVATPAEAVEHFKALVGAGMRYFLANTRQPDSETVELLAEYVIPRVQNS